MAKIPLRTYIKDVENLIERGEIEKAIAHAKSILKTYPKHIETYRLLGKAYLESQRYSDATDILQRVLSVVPDDFVSQLGMSIIREDEANLDGAIWHMERAYEVQPFNPAVQDELRRLYGRRDGIEPPKIRLTRGALIRMYARGELYPQAIAETRAALAEDPQRYDLQVLLARLYFLNGQKVEAAEVCSSLIARLPYCYEANLILSEVLPGTSRAEDARTFQQRLYALDPYAAFLSPSALTADLVPDQAVTVEQFMFETELEQQDQRPDWTRNVGVDWQETEEEQLPDWLNTLPAQEQAAPPVQADQPPASDVGEDVLLVEQPAQEDDSMPEWMRAAGWAKSDRSADEIAKEQLLVEPADRTGFEEEAAPADIPDWLKTMAPASDTDQQADEQERLNLLDSILPGAQANEASIDLPSEEEALEWFTGASDLDVQGTRDLPGSDEDQTLEPSTPMPAWLAEQETTSELSTPGEGEPAQPAEGIPDWMAGLETGSSPELESTETPGWPGIPDAEETILQATAEAEISPEGAPDWLPDLTDQDTDLSSSTSWMASSEDESAAEALLGTDDTPVSEASETTGEPLPDWLENTDRILNIPAPAMPGEEITPPSLELPEVEPSALEEPALAEDAQPAAPDFSDMDAAMAWLESLAAKQGADEATLTTRPEDRPESPPDWVQQVEPQDTTQPVKVHPSDADTLPPEPAEIVPEVTMEAPVTVEMPAPAAGLEQEDQEPGWLSEEILLEPAVEATGQSIESPDFDMTLEETTGDIEQPVDAQQPAVTEIPAIDEASETAGAMPDLSDMDATLAWLESLAAKQGAEQETLVTRPEDRQVETPDWVQNIAAQESSLASEPADETDQPLVETSGWLTEDGGQAIESTTPVPEWFEVSMEEETQIDQGVPANVDGTPAAWIPEISEGTPEPTGPLSDLPAWLQQVEADEKQAALEPGTEPKESLEDWLHSLERESTAPPDSYSPETEPVLAADTWQEPGESQAPVDIDPNLTGQAALFAAQNALNRGRLDPALETYNRFIANGEFLDEVIHDLRDALYRYPVDISVWQALGDAFARNNQLQEALDAYTKAEELLR